MRTCAVATADPELLEQILATAAAAAVEPSVVADVHGLRSHWSSAAVVVIGIDQAPAIAQAGFPRRAEVYVVGVAAEHEALCSWSGPLGAAVVVLPGSAGWLTASMADAISPLPGRGRLIAVLAGSGGVGASTWAVSLAMTAAQRDVRTALVDTDPIGGGVDLLLGAEHAAGWRWPRLEGARGHLGDLSGQLPSAAGVDVLAVSRGVEAEPGPPGVEQLSAVLRSLGRSHELVVVDVPRLPDWIGRQVARHLDLAVVVVRADVRGVSAARALLDRVPDLPIAAAVVRTRRTGLVTASTVADALGVALLGTVADDNAIRIAAERGDPPPRSRRCSTAATCRAALVEVLAVERRVA